MRFQGCQQLMLLFESFAGFFWCCNVLKAVSSDAAKCLHVTDVIQLQIQDMQPTAVVKN
jgi:hypothetical protein